MFQKLIEKLRYNPSDKILKKEVQNFIRTTQNINEQDKYSGKTLLIHLLEKSSFPDRLIISLLKIRPDIDVNIRTFKGESPLIVACRYNRSNIIIKKLVELKADVNLQDNNNKETALFHAVENGNLEVVKLLLRAGADINAQNISKQTPLMIAAKYGYLEIVKYLVNCNSNIHIKDRTGHTALHYSIAYKKPDVVDFLINAGANIEEQNYTHNVTPLLEAARKNVPKILQTLIKAGANIEAQDIYGNTPLMYASLLGYLETVETLINYKANINARSLLGKTALMQAVVCDNIDMVNLLIKNGADVNIKDNQGETALMIAIMRKNLKIVNSLLNAGANLDDVSLFIDTPFLVGKCNHTKQINRLLLKVNPQINGKYAIDLG